MGQEHAQAFVETITFTEAIGTGTTEAIEDRKVALVLVVVARLTHSLASKDTVNLEGEAYLAIYNFLTVAQTVALPTKDDSVRTIIAENVTVVSVLALLGDEAGVTTKTHVGDKGVATVDITTSLPSSLTTFQELV